MTVPAYILAGGKSSRFGSDKARALLDGVPLIRRTADALRPVVTDIIVVAERSEKYADLGLRTIADARPGLGPLGGLATAMADRLERGGAGWLLLTSCDLAEPRADWVQTLLKWATPDRRAVLFRGERLEPLLALYHTDLLPLADEHLSLAKGALWRLVEAAVHVVMPLPVGHQRLPQVNTPGELEHHQSVPVSPENIGETE